MQKRQHGPLHGRNKKVDASHATLHRADVEDDTEIAMLVTPLPDNIKPNVKYNHNPISTVLSHPEGPSHNERDAGSNDVFLSTPGNLEHKVFRKTVTSNNNEAGDYPKNASILNNLTSPSNQTTPHVQI